LPTSMERAASAAQAAPNASLDANPAMVRE